MATTISLPNRVSTPPPPQSKPIPTTFTSSLSAWWNNSSYKEARISEERLLRRLKHYNPPEAVTTSSSWFGWSSNTSSDNDKQIGNSESKLPGTKEDVIPPIDVSGEGAGGVTATLRNVFITTPNPALAPQHPADLYVPTSTPSSQNSSTSSLASGVDGVEQKKKHLTSCKKEKLVDYINTLEISRAEDQNAKEAVVVVHGYAAAMGFFFRNWEQISQTSTSTHRRTFFLDWLGMGLSSRPSPTLLSSPSNAPTPVRVARAEHFFLSSLESWRISVGLEKMILVGHSLGGYLASAYAVRYPDRVSGLILVSPAGIPRGPAEGLKTIGTGKGRTGPGGKKWVDGKPVEESELDSAAEAAEREVLEDERVTQGGAKGEAKDWEKNREASLFRKNATKLFVWGWEKGVSPFSLLRSLGPWGPMFVGRYSSRRFAAQKEEDVRDLHSYIYNTSVMKGSGEYCISHILAPGAHARMPIIDRIEKIKVPVTFIYGDNDWMDVEGGNASLKILKAAGNTKSSVHVVPNAGHHVYLDNPEVTNKIIDDAIKDVKTFRGGEVD